MTNTTQKKLLWEGIAVALGLIIAFIPAPQGLEQNAMWTLGLLIWAIVNWVSNAKIGRASCRERV